ncbi:MAG: SDR family oxidoreductase [Bacteroidota bacterium]|nr:SDR family oxidoreductase [Bacteroidota bacterium]
MKRFKDQVVWITGASSGAGEALVYEFDAEGAILIISARRENELERVKNNCSRPNEVTVLPLDLEKHDTLKQIAEKAVKRYGKIDLLFNNGGISQRALASETSPDVDKRLMNVNYLGAVHLTKAVLPHMLKRKQGHIAVMTSLTGKFGAPYRSAYAASKHALHGFFDSLRSEVHHLNIEITLVVSGYISTSIAENAFDGSGKSTQKKDVNIDGGMSPKVFAKKTIQGIFKNKNEITLGGKEKLGVYINRFFPALFAKIVRKQL